MSLRLFQSSGPLNHRAFAFGSAKAWKTRAGEAGKVRSTVKVACVTGMSPQFGSVAAR